MTNLTRFTASDLPELLDKISKNSIGMNEYLNRVFDLHETTSNYPPYNLVTVSNVESRLELALAGFKKKQVNGQPIRSDGPERHLVDKIGTPTMGGLLILGALITSTLLWARLDNGFVWVVLFVTVGFGFIGFIDDFSKVSLQSHQGISGKIRLFFGERTVGSISSVHEIVAPV